MRSFKKVAKYSWSIIIVMVNIILIIFIKNNYDYKLMNYNNFGMPALIKKGGYLGFETAGDSQAEHLLKIVPECFVLTNKIYDYNGILRHIIWQIS